MRSLFRSLQRLWKKPRQGTVEKSITVRKRLSRFSLFGFKNIFSDSIEEAGRKVGEEMYDRKR